MQTGAFCADLRATALMMAARCLFGRMASGAFAREKGRTARIFRVSHFSQAEVSLNKRCFTGAKLQKTIEKIGANHCFSLIFSNNACF